MWKYRSFLTHTFQPFSNLPKSAPFSKKQKKQYTPNKYKVKPAFSKETSNWIQLKTEFGAFRVRIRQKWDKFAFDLGGDLSSG